MYEYRGACMVIYELILWDAGIFTKTGMAENR